MKRNWYGGIGSVSTGTLRTQDLLPSFIWEAKHLRLTKEERKRVSTLAHRIDKVENGKYGDEDEYWVSEDASYDLDELCNILDNHALPYFSFSSHQGDGADFGYWLSESFREEFDGAVVDDTSEVPTGYTGEVLHVNDHGNMTLYAANRGRLRQVWAIV